jgi:pseudouridine-5'-phosphate glycosidase/pseudouridine kinase
VLADRRIGQIVDRITSLRPSLVALDGNLSASTLSTLLTHCASLEIPTLFEPTSLPKSKRVLDYLGSAEGAAIDVVTPNLLELRGIHAAADERGLFESAAWWKTVDSLGLGEDWRSAVERWARRSGAGEWVINEGGQ